MPRYRLLTAHYTEEDKWLPGDAENEDTANPITGYVLDEAGQQVLDERGQPRVYRGTIVGDGTQHKWTRPPTHEMAGLDPVAEKLVEEAKKRGGDLNPIDKLPMTMGQDMSLAQLRSHAALAGFKLVEEAKK